MAGRVLVTGATGFTGRYLTPLLAARGYEVHGQARGCAETVDGCHQLHRIELTDRDAMAKLVTNVQPTHIVHLAAIAFVAHGDVDEMFRVNLLGTRHLLEAAAALNDRPRAVLVASSAAVYGNQPGQLSEQTNLRPINDYGVSKLAMEAMAGTFADRLPIIIARPFNYTGVGQSSSYLVAKIVDHARRRAATIELGNIDVARDFGDVRGVADAYARLLDARGAVRGTFNIGSGRPTALSDVVAMVTSLSNHPLDVRVNPAFVRAQDVRSLAADTAAIEAMIGPLAMPPLRDTLAWMLNS